MRTVALICIVTTAALALPSPHYVDFDTAILIFPLVTTQSKGGNPTSMLKSIMPYLTKENSMSDTTREMFLAAGGLKPDQITRMMQKVLPVLAREGKSTYEQLMALMFVSDQFCTDKSVPCRSDDESTLPFMTMGTERGCYGDHIVTNYRTTSGDECVCDEQDNVLLWISLLDKVQRGSVKASDKTAFNKELPNQIPVILMMMLAENPCDGTLRSSGMKCQCTSVTEGNEGLLTQMVVDEPGAEQILSPLAKDKVQRYSKEPTTRQLQIADLLQFQSGINPALLTIFANDGATMQEKLIQYFLSLRGFDSSTVQLLLSGGLKNDPQNKVALINYLASRGFMSPEAIPFIVGAEKGATFYIQSMIGSGAISPILGSLLLAKQTGTSQSDVFSIITQMLTGKTMSLEGIGRPYIPLLPEGIFPGSKLYFIHLETLGVNTCSLHDLRNRFDCGYDGIGAAQCEYLPYCCYNPVFLTDDEVSNMTEGAITAASAVPWCYYNVFFIYYNSFALTVQRPGGFAAPSSCLPLFKFGLNIDASVYFLLAQSSKNNAISKLVNLRAECGFPGITEFHCVAIRGCCWDKYAPFRVPQCYKVNGGLPVYDLNSIPVAYQPRNLTCSINPNKFPILYYRRSACMTTWEMFATKKRSPLYVPDRRECLMEYGCCWEEEDAVVQKYPRLSRCYQREDGNYAVQPNNIAQQSDLFPRSGRIDRSIYPSAKP